MPATVHPLRIEIAAPDGYTVLSLERRLAGLAHAKVAEARGWVLELEDVEHLEDVEVAVAEWLRDNGLASTHMVVGGRHEHVAAAEAVPPRAGDHQFEVHPDSPAV